MRNPCVNIFVDRPYVRLMKHEQFYNISKLSINSENVSHLRSRLKPKYMTPFCSSISGAKMEPETE